MKQIGALLLGCTLVAAYEKEQVEITKIESSVVHKISDILEVDKTFGRSTIPAGYIPESCTTIVIPGAYSNPNTMILQSQTQIHCTQKLAPARYVAASQEIPSGVHYYGDVTLTHIHTQASNGKKIIVSQEGVPKNISVGQVCDSINGRIFNCH